jgi:hypothetical protein
MDDRSIVMMLKDGPMTVIEMSNRVAQNRGYGKLRQALFCGPARFYAQLHSMERRGLVGAKKRLEDGPKGKQVIRFDYQLTQSAQGILVVEPQIKEVAAQAVADHYGLDSGTVLSEDFRLPTNITGLASELTSALSGQNIRLAHHVLLEAGMSLNDVVDQFLFPRT